MKVYLCVQSEYEGSEAFRACKSEKKAQYIVTQVNRLLNVHKELRKLSQTQSLKYWNNNPQLIDSTKIEIYYHSEEWKKINKLMKKIDNLLEIFGANSFYRTAHVEEKRLE